MFAVRIFSRLFDLIRNIVLAKLLSPDDFGLFGIALLFLSMLDTFSYTGFDKALIQKKENINTYLNTAWTVGLLRGIVIAAILLISAPYVATFFNAPQAKDIVKVIGLSMFLQSAVNIAVVRFEKELEFHKYFTYQISGTLVDLIVAVSLAFALRSVWALAFGKIAGNFVRCITSYVIDKYRPRFELDLAKAKELFGFGKWILGSSILFFLIVHGDDIFVGKILGTTALGLYQMAYLFSHIPSTEITALLSRVTFPVYSKIQDDILRLRRAYLQVLNVTAFITFPVSGLVFLLGPYFIRSFLGQKWVPMIAAMQILVFAGAIRAIKGVNGPILQALKRPDVAPKVSAIKLFILAVLIYPLTVRWGIEGTALAVLISSVLTIPNSFYITLRKVIDQDVRTVIRELIVPLTGTLLMVLFIRLIFPGGFSGAGVCFGVIFGICMYLAITYVLDRMLGHKSWENISSVLKGALQ